MRELRRGAVAPPGRLLPLHGNALCPAARGWAGDPGLLRTAPGPTGQGRTGRTARRPALRPAPAAPAPGRRPARAGARRLGRRRRLRPGLARPPAGPALARRLAGALRDRRGADGRAAGPLAAPVGA